MKILFSGGCKNGKSTIAEDVSVSLCKNGRLYYIATMIPHDEEDEQRIIRHLKNRCGKGFTTIEAGEGLSRLCEDADPEGTYLLDSLTALLSNEMFPTKDGKNFGFKKDAPEKVAGEVLRLSTCVKNLIVVSDYIFSGQYGEALTERYRAGLSMCQRLLAARFDTVCEVCLGQTFNYKGELPK